MAPGKGDKVRPAPCPPMAGLIRMLKLPEDVLPEESVTCAVKTAFPAVVGVPPIDPVADCSVSPSGKDPDVTLKV